MVIKAKMAGSLRPYRSCFYSVIILRPPTLQHFHIRSDHRTRSKHLPRYEIELASISTVEELVVGQSNRCNSLIRVGKSDPLTENKTLHARESEREHQERYVNHSVKAIEYQSRKETTEGKRR